MIFDNDLKYCPRCQDEYRADIEKCADCGLLLLTGRQIQEMVGQGEQQRLSRKGALTPEDEVVTIHKGALPELRDLEEKLTRENIGVLIMSDQPAGCNKGCCPSDFYLQVRKEDARDAFAILGEEFQRSTSLHDHDLAHVDQVFNRDASHAICPACGFEFETKATICPDCGLCFG